MPIGSSNITISGISSTFGGPGTNVYFSSFYNGGPYLHGSVFGYPNGGSYGSGTPTRIPTSGTLRFSNFAVSEPNQHANYGGFWDSICQRQDAPPECGVDLLWYNDGTFVTRELTNLAIAPFVTQTGYWLYSSPVAVGTDITNGYLNRLDLVSGPAASGSAGLSGYSWTVSVSPGWGVTGGQGTSFFSVTATALQPGAVADITWQFDSTQFRLNYYTNSYVNLGTVRYTVRLIANYGPPL